MTKTFELAMSKVNQEMIQKENLLENLSLRIDNVHKQLFNELHNYVTKKEHENFEKKAATKADIEKLNISLKDYSKVSETVKNVYSLKQMIEKLTQKVFDKLAEKNELKLMDKALKNFCN